MTAVPLSIALPTPSFLPNTGGAEVGLHNIARCLEQFGHKPVVIAPEPHVRRLRRDAWHLPYEIVSFPPKIWGILRHWPAVGSFLFEQYYARLQRQYGFDVWHGTMAYPIGVTLIPFATKRNLPHLVRCAGEDIQVSPEIGYGFRLNSKVDQLVRRWLPQADRLVATTESVADEYRALNVGEERIARIPNGVDLSRFGQPSDRLQVRRRHGIDDETFLFLTVSRNHPKKNLAGLVRAVALLETAREQDFKVLIVGAGTGSLLPLVRELGLADRVALHGEIGGQMTQGGEVNVPSDALVELYQTADAFVLPSLLETFGIVLVEAMAAGLPVITTDAPGCRDVARGGIDAVVAPAGDDAALADAMGRLILEDTTRRDLSRRARKRAADFSWDSVVEQYLALYQKMIDENSWRSNAA